jgi:hypothetical protein
VQLHDFADVVAHGRVAASSTNFFNVDDGQLLMLSS